jgi:xanthine dehydrogenase accessory factor
VNNIFDKITEAQQSHTDVALCVIVNTKGSTPRETGARMLVYATGKIYGTIGGGDLEKKVIANALEVIKVKKPALFKHDLQHQHNMCCGGSLDIYIEPIMKKNKLYIFGAGHTGQALARHVLDIDFEIFMVDDRKEYLDEITGDHVNKLHMHYGQALPLLPFDDSTYITIMTYSHSHDRDILAYCMKKPHAYLGMIGSERKVAMTKKMFEEGKIAAIDELQLVDMPMGIDIGAKDPEEIAISILAKMIEVKNKAPVNQ